MVQGRGSALLSWFRFSEAILLTVRTPSATHRTTRDTRFDSSVCSQLTKKSRKAVCPEAATVSIEWLLFFWRRLLPNEETCRILSIGRVCERAMLAR